MDKKTNFSYGRRTDDPRFEHHWQEVDIEKFKVSKPLVLVLGGSGTIHDEQNNGNVKVVESLLGVFKQDVDVIGVTYNYAFSDETQTQSIDKIVSNIFLPIISDNGKRLTTEVALKNMRNITIFAHCYGDFKILTKILNNLEEQMAKLGYSTTEIQYILKQIFAVSYGTAPLQASERHVKSFTVVSASDEYWINSEIDWYRLLDAKDVKISKADMQKLGDLPKFDNGEIQFSEFYQKNGRCFIFAQDEDEIRAATGMLHKKDDGDHSLSELRRQENWQVDEHASKAGDYVSRCLACALCHSVANSMLNNQNDEFIEIDMADLRAELENVVRPLNFEEPEPGF